MDEKKDRERLRQTAAYIIAVFAAAPLIGVAMILPTWTIPFLVIIWIFVVATGLMPLASNSDDD